VSSIKKYFGPLERNATSFGYETPSGDVPRLVSSSVSAQNWTGVNGLPAQVTTQYSVAGDGACVMTAPDGTVYREYYGTGWQKGLTTLSEVWVGIARKKWTTTAWTQDNTSVSYETNPRVTETNVYDAGNRRRTTIDYGQYAQWGLPYIVSEYAADGTTEIRRTFTDYNLSQAYLDRRIIGLVSGVHLTNVSSFQGKVTYEYDDPQRLAPLPTATPTGTPATATQHDTTYNTSFTARGNLTSVSRWNFSDINNASKKVTSYTNYFVTGTPALAIDPSTHTSSISYTDAFSDGVNRNTFAYPTTLTDADSNSSTVKYNFDFGATTRTQSPAPANQTQGMIQTMAYNNLGQLERVITVNNGGYQRFWYGPNYVASYTSVNNVADELYAVQAMDGLGRVMGSASNHPGSSGGYRLVSIIYDQMGRLWQQSNPTEIDSSWLVSGDDAGAIYYTQQSYDWKGRPLVTINTDGTTKEASYSGCGCAGGTVVTLTDEGTIDAGVAKRRQQKIYSDVLGRTVKTEILNWQNGSVYSATVNTYNVRDQLTQIRQYAGAEGSSTFQDTIMIYDGHGRLKTSHVPEQQVDPNNSNSSDHTTWQYNADDTIDVITDARGATTTFTYNNARHLPNTIAHALAGSATIVETFAYDAAGNRTLMSDSAGSTSYQYDQLSRLTSETRQFNGMAGSYLLTYQYNLAGQLTMLTYPGFNTSYTYDTTGRTKTVTGPPRWTGITQYVSDIQYRASDSYKTISYGSGTSLSVDYNVRMQLQSYKIKEFFNNQWIDVAHVEPQYFADGSVRTTQDFLDPRFNRSYSFDHVGSLRQAGSGVYNQTFQHDAFGNTTNRQSGIWSQSDTFTATWVNGRNQNTGWQYDADGNVRFDTDFEYTYDAKGLNSKLRDLSNNLWIAQSANAEGQMTKRSTGDATATFTTTYYLRSTVLGGKVVAEYNPAGQQQKRYVYFDGKLLATDDANNFFLEHVNPLTGSRGESRWSGNGGTYSATAEPDSSGVVDVGFSDPNNVPPPPPEEPDIASILPGPSGQCRVEGIQSEFGCYLALRLMTGGSALRCPNDDCNAHLMTVTQTVGGKIAAVSRFYVTAGDPGWDGSLDGAYGWFPPLSNKIDLNDPKHAKHIVSKIPELLKNEYLTRVGAQPVGSQPQDPVSNNPPTIDNSDAANQSCSIQVSFSGSYYGNPNGPSIGSSGGQNFYGIGFSVKVSGLSGNVALRSSKDDPKPKGTWLVEQWVTDFNFKNGAVTRQDSVAQIDNLARAQPRPRRDGDVVSWWDHPGIGGNDTLGYFTKRNFYIKAYKGKKHCEVEFHLTFRVFNRQIATPGWGYGPYR
jgi:YD repeat-containing protein